MIYADQSANRLIRLGVALFKWTCAVVLGGIISGCYFLWFVLPAIEHEVSVRERQAAAQMMRHNQMCVKQWRNTPNCTEWQ